MERDPEFDPHRRGYRTWLLCLLLWWLYVYFCNGGVSRYCSSHRLMVLHIKRKEIIIIINLYRKRFEYSMHVVWSL